MSAAKHSAGPWRVSLTDDTVVVDAAGREVAAIDGDYNDPDTWPIMEANARLVAAGPDLLEALSLLREACRHAAFDNGVTAPDGRNEGDHWAGSALDLADAALAKVGSPTPRGANEVEHLRAALKWALPVAEARLEILRDERVKAGLGGMTGGLLREEIEALDRARAALAA